MKKICAFIGSRANYGSLKSVLIEIKKSEGLDLTVIVGASALLDRYGSVINRIKEDGFEIDAYAHMQVEGETPKTTAISSGLGLIEISNALERLTPDLLLIVGDRYEVMTAAFAGVLMNIPIAHTMGGEVSGTIDESLRHAITKLASVHFPASESAYQRILRLGELEENTHLVGCPRIDITKQTLETKTDLSTCSELMTTGVGPVIDFNKPFMMFSLHPVWTEYEASEQQTLEMLTAINRIGMPIVGLWPNSDAGSDGVSRAIRKWREQHPSDPLHLFKALPVEIYFSLMDQTICLVGNSSSGIREGAFIGTPVVNIGTRQNLRERGQNVVDVDPIASEIEKAVRIQIKNGKSSSETIYGDGYAGKRIADILYKTHLSSQKPPMI